MARTLFITQFIGRSCLPLIKKDVPVATINYRLLKQISAASSNDSLELLTDFYRFNRFSRQISGKLTREMTGLLKTLAKPQRPRR
jgi:hypothetical protein